MGRGYKIGLMWLSVLAGLTGCAGVKMEQDFPIREPGNPGNIITTSELKKIEKRDGKAFGDNLDFLFGEDKKADQKGGSSVEVSAYLWRASLDTISFMPLLSADPFGGVIITDWHSPPETPNERFKLTVYILSRQLRADGIRVSVFREQFKNGTWHSAKTTKGVGAKLENKILIRARELRIKS